jgi:hypothetical protein
VAVEVAMEVTVGEAVTEMPKWSWKIKGRIQRRRWRMRFVSFIVSLGLYNSKCLFLFFSWTTLTVFINPDGSTMQLFRRIMENASCKQKHSYRLSYAYEVGRSLDPDIENIGRWEEELQGVHFFFSSSWKRTIVLNCADEPWSANLSPQDIEDEELKEYAEEYAALVDFEDMEGGEWSLSDLDDIDPDPQITIAATSSGIEAADNDMNVS